MKVTNTSKALQGVNTSKGLAWVPPGETRELPVTAADAAQIAKIGFFKTEGEPDSDDPSLLPPGVDVPPNEIDQFRLQLQTAQGQISRLTDLLAERDAEIAALKATAEHANDTDAVPAGPYEVKETSAGWFGIFAANGEQIGKNMRASDADAFKAMSPEDQAAYLSPASDKS